MKFEEILTQIGGFGRYQICVFIYVNCINFIGAFSALSYVFFTGKSDHWCKVFDQPNCTAYGFNTDVECTEAVKAVSIPPAPGYPDDTEYYYKNCYQWDIPASLEFSPGINYTDYNATQVACQNGWEYNTSIYKTTIISEWDLVCKDEGVPNTINSVFFLGYLAGSFILGVVSDWLGRKWGFFIGACVWVSGMAATPFVTDTWQLYLVRFITGTGQMGRYIPLYVLLTEYVGPGWRGVVGVVVGTAFSLGYVAVGFVALALPKWRTLAFVPIIPGFLSIFGVLLFSESARWLLSKGRVKKAEAAVRRIAKINGKELPDVIFDEKEVEEYKEAAKGRQPSVIDLYRSPNMCYKMVTLQFNWMVNSLVYYGLSFSTGDLGENDYWAFILSGAVEIPAQIYATLGSQYTGRKWNMFGLEFIGGLACLATFFIDDSTARTAVALVGKFCITATFSIIYLWTSEVFPTPVRSVAIGFCSVASRIGGIAAPLTLNLGSNIHLILSGTVTVLAALSLIPMPKTKGKRLPETMADGEEFGKLDCMRGWKWGRDYSDDENADVDMEAAKMEAVNPAYVPDEELQPPSYEIGCQFPEAKPSGEPEKEVVE